MAYPAAAPVLPARLLHAAEILPDRLDILPLLPRGGVFVEVGVGFGELTEQVLEICRPSRFVAIDTFTLHHLDAVWGVPTGQQFAGATHEQAYRRRFAAAIGAGRMDVLPGDSAAMLATLPDGAADIIYLDADHGYEAVAGELAIAIRKIRPDGWIVLNDYLMVPEIDAPYCYGVVHAAHEFMLAHDWGMRFLAQHTRMFADVALRPAHLLPGHAQALADAQAQVALLRAQLAAMRASRSWAITAPVRWAARAIRPRAAR